MPYGSISVDQINNTTGYSLGAGDASLMKNRIINGAMVIDQRATSISATGYSVDRWRIYNAASSKMTAAQSSTAPTGFSKSLLLTSTSAFTIPSNYDGWIAQQYIEGFNTADLMWGTANAKTVTLSFWVQSSLTGTFGGSITNGAGNRAYPFSYTISSANTWEYKTITIAGDTTGTWVGATNGVGMRVNLSVGMGSDFATTAGSWATGEYYSVTGAVSIIGTNGATWYVTGVQLEVGSSATGFEYRQYQQELALCQRYYWQRNGLASNNKIVASGALYTSTDVRCCVPCPVTMRTIPTVAFTGSGFGYERPNTSLGTIGTPSSEARTAEAVYLTSGSGTTSGTAGNGTHWFITDGTSNIGVSAEL